MNKYLEKIAEIEKEANRLTKFIAENRDAFPKERLEHLYRQGMLKSPLRIARGHKKWDKKQMQQLGVKHETLTGGVKERFESAYGGAGTAGAYLPERSSIAGNTKGIVRTHETAEASEYDSLGMKDFNEKAWEKLNRPDLREKVRDMHLNDPEIKAMIPESVKETTKHFPTFAPVTNSGQLMGLHNSLAVLGRESNAIRSNPYSHVTNMKVPDGQGGHARVPMPAVRQYTGEDRLVGRITGKRFGIDKMTNKDLRKLNKAKPTGPAVEVEMMPGVHVPFPYSHDVG